MCQQLASAIGAAHSHGYIHCDIKPANVALRRGHDGDSGLFMSVLDWGLAEKLDPPKRRFRGDGRGTDGFIAPEMESHKMCTSAIDIYSLGVTFESFDEWVPRRASVADWKALDRKSTRLNSSH